MPNLDEEKIREFIETAQKQITYCLTCQPWDEGEAIWIFGVRTDMYDLLWSLEIPEEYYEDVASRLCCPHCGAELEITSVVGTKTQYEQKLEKMWNEWYEAYEWRLEEFHKYLGKYPYLGISHKLGAEIMESIGTFPKLEIVNQKWYRARNICSGKLLSPPEMLPPDPHKVVIPEGRYNHFGQSVFYLAENKEACVKEILREGETIAWIQEFQIKKASSVLDLIPDDSHEPPLDLPIIALGLIYGRATQEPVEKTKGWKPEYFVSRFIADCAKSKGFKSVRFKTLRHYFNNLVLFEWSADQITPIGKPSLFSLRKGEKGSSGFSI